MTHDDLLKRLREATGADREADEALALMAGWRHVEEPVSRVRSMTGEVGPGTIWCWYRPDGTEDYVPRFTASLDASIGLVERMLPDTDDNRYHGVVWFGQNPAARIFYDSRDTEAEGGWSIGALNPHEVHAPTPALALLIALLEALNAQEPRKP